MNRFAYISLLMLTMIVGTIPIIHGAARKEFTIIIDPGHGGGDIGAPGTIINEKDINLAVALALGKMFRNDKDIKVVYTRSTDRFVTLQKRADIANRADGDLFISIHTNSIDKSSKNRTTARGAAVYTLGLGKSSDNLAVAMRENSVMKLEDDYTSTYQGFDPTSAESYIIFELSQNKHLQQSVKAARHVLDRMVTTASRKNNGVRQANFWVLWKTAMPAMLIELDFICNPTEEKFMASESGQKKLAKAIYEGVMAYRGRRIADTQPEPEETKAKPEKRDQEPEKRSRRTESAPAPDNDRQIVYRIQFMTSPTSIADGDKRFKGLDPVSSYKDGGLFKYTFGAYSSVREGSADLKKVRSLFPDAFIIKTQGGKRIK